MKRGLPLILSIVGWLCSISAFGQFTVATTHTANNGSTAVTFEVTASAPIIITGIANAYNSGSISAEVWYRVGGVLHAGATTPNVSAANGWVQLVATTVAGNGSTPVPIPGNYQLNVAAGQVVGICVTGGTRYMTYAAGAPTSFTDNTLTINTGPGKGFGGSFPNPTIATRDFVGSVTYQFAGPCINPPYAGNTVSDKSITCSGERFTLSMDSLTSGLGQTYQWQISPDSLVWSNITGATAFTLDTSQTATNYYRCIITCSASDTSTAVKVTTNSTPLAAGTYSINSGLPTAGTNFASFTDLAQKINCSGIAGPIVVNVAPFSGPYVEQVRFNFVGGSSSTNTITINGNGEVLSYASGVSGNYATLTLDGAENFIFNNLKIEVGSTASSGWALWMTNMAKNIEIDSCTISVPLSLTTSLSAALVTGTSATSATTTGLGATDYKVTNCIIEGGYYGFVANGNTTAPYSSNNIIQNNIIRDFYLYGLFVRGQENTLIEGNDISRAQRTTLSTFYGLYLNGEMVNTKVLRNAIHNISDQNTSSTSTAYPIYATTVYGRGGAPLLIANNIMYNLNTDGTVYGIYQLTGDSIAYYHNTISVDNVNATGASTIRAMFISSSSGYFDVKNNIFSITEGGTGTKTLMYLSSTNPTFSINYNQYFSSATGTNILGYYGGNQNSLSDFQTASSQEANGVVGDPLFVNPAIGDLTPSAPPGNNNGLNLQSIVPIDFTGASRPTTPDRGAFEFSPLYCLQPYNLQFDTVTTSSVFLSWINDAAADSVKIEWVPCGGSQGTGNFVFVADSSYTVTGLMDNTCYDFYFTSYCGGTIGNGTGVLQGVTTKCLPFSMPYVEPFTTWVPQCVELSSGGGGSWTWIHRNNDFAEGNFWSNSVGFSTMRMAVVDVSTRAWMRFRWAHLYSASYPDDRLVIRAAIEGSGNWDTLVDFVGPTFTSPNATNTNPPSKTDFIETSVVLDTSFTGEDVEFELIALTDFGPDLYIDDFIVEQVPSCLPPFDLTASNITTSGATIGWQTISGTSFNIEYGPCGFQQGSGVGTVVTNVTQPYTMSGLSPNTCYHVYVNDPCSNSWTGPLEFTTPCLSQLNGLYTVGGPAGPNNFATLDSAVAELNGCGISGPVIFDLAPGTYMTSMVMAEITGSSPTNTVTWRGQGVGLDTIRAMGQGAVTLNGTKNMIFKNLTIETTSGFTIWMNSGARNITIDSCHVIASLTSTTTLDNPIIASGLNTTASNYQLNAYDVTVTNSKIIGGYYGVRINGQSTTSRTDGYVIENNEFEGQYFYAAYFYYCDSIRVANNVMGNFRSTGGYGFYAYYPNYFEVEANNIKANTYPIYVSQGNTSITQSTNSKIINNMCVGGAYGMFLATVNNMDMYHNSSKGNTYGIYFSGSTYNNSNIRNNIFQGGSSYAFYVTSGAFPSSTSIDYNLYHSVTGANIAYYGTTIRTDLTAWQTAYPTLNVNSLQGDPVFSGPDDLHIVGTLPNDQGDNTAGVTVDIDGDVRPASGALAVDMGADEFTPKQWDAEYVALLGANGGCGDSAVALEVVVRNLGQQTITSLPISVAISGTLTTTLNTTATVNIASLDVDTISVGTFNIYNGGVVSFNVGLALANDQEISNDSGSVMNVLYLPFQPIVFSGDSVCANVDSVDLAALTIPGTMYGWYANMTDTVALAMGDTFRAPVSGQSTYYVEYLNNADSLLTTFAAGNGQSGNMFDLVIKNGISLTGLTVNPQSSGSVTFEVYYRSGSFVGFEGSSAGWTLIETHVGTAVTAGGYYFPLTTPLTMAPGLHSLYVTATNGSVSYTNGTSAGSIYASNNDIDFLQGVGIAYPWAGTFNPRIWNGILHYGSVGCSNIRVPVSFGVDSAIVVASGTATASGTGSLTANFDASTTTGGDVYTWKFGDGNTGTGMTTSHTYGQGGDYTVWLIATDTTCGTVDSVQIALNGLNVEENLLNRSLNIFPNPTQGVFHVTFDIEGVQKVQVRLLNLLGEEIALFDHGTRSGQFAQDYDLTGQADGVYLIEIRTDRGITTRRINLHR